MSTDERRALALIAALLVLAAGARWLERPRPLLMNVPDLDLTALEAASRSAQQTGATGRRARGSARGRRARADSARASAPGGISSRAGTARAATVAGRGAASGGAAGRVTTGAPDLRARLDPNAASAEELDGLPGVGPSLAARIVEERARAPFASAADLQRVRGIGAALASRLADHVTLAPGAAPPDRPFGTAATPLEKAPAAPPAGDGAQPLDMNEVSSTDLQRVPGVGPVLAARLIARRDSLGRFNDWDQVDAVNGVGPALLNRLRQAAILGR